MVKIREFPGMGRGVMASVDFIKDEWIETSLVLVIPKSEVKSVEKTILGLYTYYWNFGCVALALGTGSFFNHSDKANVTYEIDTEHNCINYFATRTILAGEQLFIDYGYDPVAEEKAYKKAKK